MYPKDDHHRVSVRAWKVHHERKVSVLGIAVFHPLVLPQAYSEIHPQMLKWIPPASHCQASAQACWEQDMSLAFQAVGQQEHRFQELGLACLVHRRALVSHSRLQKLELGCHLLAQERASLQERVAGLNLRLVCHLPTLAWALSQEDLVVQEFH